ncbi:MAG: glycosyltransferase [Flavobacteriales bacterium]|nr:glycosyltransferase [Flavobacteriales bacterium]
MPKVLRIINRFNLGGPTHNAAYLTRYLPKEYETLLVGGMWDASEEGSKHILDAIGVEPLILPELQREVAPWRDRVAYARIKQLIKDFRPDIVHTHASKAGAIGRMAAAEMGVKVVVHTFHGHVFHSYFGALRTQVYKNIERFLARRSDRIVAISDKQKHELVDEHRICKAEKVSVIPLGFDLTKFRTDMATKRQLFRRVYGVADDEVAIGIVGRLVPIKDHDMFLETLRDVEQKTQRRIRAFIVGDGEERERLEQRARELGLGQVAGPYFNGQGFGHGVNGKPMVERAALTFCSWIKEVDIVNAGLDIAVLTSRNEGTPVSLIEAQASDRPIVATNVGGIENVVVPGRTALLSPSGDIPAFAANLLRLVEDEGLRQRMGAQGWDHVRERYHFTRLVNDTASLYGSLLN